MPNQKMWTAQDMADYLGVAPNSLYRWRAAGVGPKWIKVGKVIRYYPIEKLHGTLSYAAVDEETAR